MSSVYSRRIRSKKNSELVQILTDRNLYDNDAVKIALDEIKKREISNGHDSTIDVQNLILQTDEEIAKKEASKKEEIAKRVDKYNFWKTLPRKHIWDLVTVQ